MEKSSNTTRLQGEPTDLNESDDGPQKIVRFDKKPDVFPESFENSLVHRQLSGRVI